MHFFQEWLLSCHSPCQSRTNMPTLTSSHIARPPAQEEMEEAAISAAVQSRVSCSGL